MNISFWRNYNRPFQNNQQKFTKQENFVDKMES
nr:MAG TPA: hypothetical protein [Caudoviricetes sp.]